MKAPHGARRGEYGFPHPDRGGVLSGAAALLARWRYGGNSPHLLNLKPKIRMLCLGPAVLFLKMNSPAANDFEKRSDQFLRILEKSY